MSNKLLLLCIFIITFFVFIRSANFDFIYNWDDNVNVVDNKYIKDFSINGIRTLFSKNTSIEEPRFTLFTYSLQYYFSKLNPAPYHVLNLLLHLVNILLVYFFVKKLWENLRIALFVTVLFAIHPLRVESVAWITGRKDLLYTMFFLSSVLLYLEYIKGRFKIFFYGVVILAYFSFLSKIQAITLPAVLLLLDYFFKRKISAIVFYEKLILGIMLFNVVPWTFVACMLLVYGFMLLFDSKITDKISSRFKIVLILIPSLIFSVIIFRISRYPGFINLIFVGWFIFEKYKSDKINLTNINLSVKKKFLIGFTIVLTLFLAVFFLGKQMHYWNTQIGRNFTIADRFCMACYSINFYLNKLFIPINLSAIYPYPEKVSGVLPSIYYYSVFITAFIFFSFGWLIYHFKKLRKEILFCLGFFFVNIFLFLHIIPIQGRLITADRYSYMAFLGLFILLGFFLDKLILERPKYGKIILLAFLLVIFVSSMLSWNRVTIWKNETSMFTDVIEKHPGFPLALTNRGTIYYKNGRVEEAMKDYDSAIHADSAFALAYYNRALAFSNQKEFQKAIVDCNAAIKWDTVFFSAYYLRGYLLNESGNFSAAIKDLDRAILINPQNDFAYFTRAVTYKNLQEYEFAVADYTSAISMNPNFYQAFSNRGVAKYFINDFPSSVQDFNSALKLNPQYAIAYFNRALSELKLNMKNEACEDFRKSHELGYSNSMKYIEENCK